METSFKTSYYNFLIPIKESNEFLLYNTKTCGMELLNENVGKLILKLSKKKSFYLEDHLQSNEIISYLLDKSYIVKSEIDETSSLHQIYSRQKDVYGNDSADINLTIGTTIICNMGCAYCFEFTKPSKSLKDEKNIDAIISYLQDMIDKSPVKNWGSLNVTWYGGEPLVNSSAIEKLSPKLLGLCEKNKIRYSASIITNGILLNRKTWMILKNNNVTHAQVTIDGPKEIHDIQRPLISKSGGKNYERILENIASMPSNMHTVIRINVDRKIANSFSILLKDLEQYGIWPHRYKEVTFDVAWLRTYEEAKEKDTSDRLSPLEYYYAIQEFRKERLKIFNNWAKINQVSEAKLKWYLPSLQSDCATWVSPYSMVIDPDGNIHKCWETIHDSKQSVNHVSKGYNLEDFKKFREYDRYTLNEECTSCKYLPICDQLSCSHQALKNSKPPCTYWKYSLMTSLREQYLFMKNNPDKMILSGNSSKANTGHSNK